MRLPGGIGYLGSPVRVGPSREQEDSCDVSALHHR
jgi:hypothetical protein